MKKFEPRYRLVRYGMATKVEKASRQQRTLSTLPRILSMSSDAECLNMTMCLQVHRQAAQEQDEGAPRYRQDQGCCEEGQEISGCTITMTTKVMVGAEWRLLWNWPAWYFTMAGTELQRASTCTAMKA
jgi:hypothetical protein